MGKIVYFEKPDVTQQLNKNEDTEKKQAHVFFGHLFGMRNISTLAVG